MNTLRSELSRLQKERDMVRLTEIRETIEDVRESVSEIMQKKQDC